MQSIKKTLKIRNANGMPAAPKTQAITHKVLFNKDLKIFKIKMPPKESGVRLKDRLQTPNI
jgi:hypothetical protein